MALTILLLRIPSRIFTRSCEKGLETDLFSGKEISRIPFRTEKEDYFWRLSTISEKMFPKITSPLDLKPKFPDFDQNGKHPPTGVLEASCKASSTVLHEREKLH